jgi:ATP-dependent DNA helicase RecG
MTLDQKISVVPLIGPSFATRLEKLGIFSVSDLLYYLPFRYDDFSLISQIGRVQPGETVTVHGTVESMKNQFTGRGFILQNAKISDDTGSIEAVWFNQTFLTKSIHKGDVVNFSGKVTQKGPKIQLQSPHYEVIRPSQPPIHTGRLVPVYSETAGITSKWLRSRLWFLLDQVRHDLLKVQDLLPENIKKEYDLMDLKTALFEVHFPSSLEMAQKARERLGFNELLEAQVTSMIKKHSLKKTTVGNRLEIAPHVGKIFSFMENLPFKLTNSQKKVVEEIFADLSQPSPMNRLLQGDVGSGKTVVAALAILLNHLNGYESVIMAPTEVLAFQHFETISKMLAPMKIAVGIATGSKKDWQKASVVIGTHALIQEKINFKSLGLVVIDEQHRFGVDQRQKLIAKGVNPHILTMTATPIPRTIALTLYGDLDLSSITEMPKNRLPVKTRIVAESKRKDAYDWIRKQTGQVFIICPLIEESEDETLASIKSAKAEYDRLRTKVFPEKKVALIHGRLSTKEKTQVLADFKAKKFDILVATPVVEVGIDIPSATIMIIEGAERFGLAQLHQLRGRVGRGEEQSYCFLFANSETARLTFLEKINNGLELAEVDLKFRGPGQRFGTVQHGSWDLKIANFSDIALVEKTKALATKIVAHPTDFPLLRAVLIDSKIDSVRN